MHIWTGILEEAVSPTGKGDFWKNRKQRRCVWCSTWGKGKMLDGARLGGKTHRVCIFSLLGLVLSSLFHGRGTTYILGERQCIWGGDALGGRLSGRVVLQSGLCP